MSTENGIKALIIPSNLNSFSNNYKCYLLYKHNNQNTIQIWAINIIKLGKYIMHNNNMYVSRLYEGYYNSVFLFLSLRT